MSTLILLVLGAITSFVIIMLVLLKSFIKLHKQELDLETVPTVIKISARYKPEVYSSYQHRHRRSVHINEHNNKQQGSALVEAFTGNRAIQKYQFNSMF